MKNILIIWLWWQGKKFLNFFAMNKTYNIYWCCKTDLTKLKIQNEYDIDVYLDYKNVLNSKKIDLVISTVFPTEEQYNIVIDILESYNVKVLVDLPISFDLDKLKYILQFDNLYLINIEHYTKIFDFISNNVQIIDKIETTLYINKDNLKNQLDLRKALLVDKFYVLNNLLAVDFKKIYVSYKYKLTTIKDIEFYLKIFLNNSKVIYYKYEDSKGIIIDKNNNVIVDIINYSNIINRLLINIFFDKNINKNNLFKRKHLEYWSYLIN